MTYPALPKKRVGGQGIPQWFSSFDNSYLPVTCFVTIDDSLNAMFRSNVWRAMQSSLTTDGGGQVAVHGPQGTPKIIGPRFAWDVSPGGRAIIGP